LQWGLFRFIARRDNAEHQLMRAFPSPDFDTTLQRSQQFIRISVWLLRLKPSSSSRDVRQGSTSNHSRICVVTVRMDPGIGANIC
jgi:hypothetical protein